MSNPDNTNKTLRDQHRQLSGRSPLLDAITANYCTAEAVAVSRLLGQTTVLKMLAPKTHELALRLADNLRNQSTAATDISQNLLQEFSLSDNEGIALMCLAEALLRIPDTQTRDALIRDKVAAANWQRHLGSSPSMFVNAAAWGLLLTRRVITGQHEAGLAASLRRLVAKGGEPLIRTAADIAMRTMGEQFVAGETIEEALANATLMEQAGFQYSYDMLGEAALTGADARRYMDAYEQAVHAIGQASNHRGIHEGPGISIKLSALHPRYARAKLDRVMVELYPRLRHLAMLAKHYHIGLNIDAEEADRLDISLRLAEQLCLDPLLMDWDGIGLAIQAYQKRCPHVIDYLLDLARRSGHRLMIRLVKGAYWDTEIKRAQVNGFTDYPVYTRKAHTDLAYLVCAHKLLGAPDACYPQFGTHNAHTLAAVYNMAGSDYTPGQYEFQCLHGMGEPLYRQVVGAPGQDALDRPCRIYAPVGTHRSLLPYLARRLIENGANTSFVNQLANESHSVETLIEDPIDNIERTGKAEGQIGLPHPRIPLPAALFGQGRVNSQGMDLSNEQTIAALTDHLLGHETHQWHAAPIIEGLEAPGPCRAVRNPAKRSDVAGHVIEATALQATQAITIARQGFHQWSQTPPGIRAAALEAAGALLEDDALRFMGILIREAGKTYANALAEIRETVDFLRFYALQAKRDFANHTHVPLGPVVCISPWNFPLSIFTGQIAAALAAGNTVLAKPAEQTPLVACEMVRLLLKAGIPQDVLQFLPGTGEETGAALIADTRIKGVLFTGSIEVAKTLARQIAGRINEQGALIPLIAETGGQNAMLVDSSALPEQVVSDVLASAFDSAGQRCSALRVLCLQDDVAEPVIEMLKGAMSQLTLGDPIALSTDIGPVIDDEAKRHIVEHLDRLQAEGHAIYQAHDQKELDHREGIFVAPTLIDIPSVLQLKHEVFGPVLHIVRYQRQDFSLLVEQINQLGFGLTFGLHSRIDETTAKAVSLIKAGNAYINRNIVGAVVGVQPFGGEGLSGTGPKAGGPLYALRLLSRQPASAASRAIEAFGAAEPADSPARQALKHELLQMEAWAVQHQRHALASACRHFAQTSPCHTECTLAGPTGERNLYRIVPKEKVLCLAENRDDLLVQLAAITATGTQALMLSKHADMLAGLPQAVVDRVQVIEDWPGQRHDAVLFHGSVQAATELAGALARQNGPIVSLIALKAGGAEVPLERLVLERSISINTAAAGGNAALMTMFHPHQGETRAIPDAESAPRTKNKGPL